MSKSAQSKPSVKDIFESMEYGPISEGKSLAEAWIAEHVDQLGPFINGKFSPAKDDVHSVRTGFNNGVTLKLSDQHDSPSVLNAATTASVSWKLMDGHERAKVLYNVARQMQKHLTLLIQMEAVSRGVQMRDAREIDVPAIIRIFYYYAGWAQLASTDLKGYQPYGVIAGVTSSSSPLLSLALIIAPALATGNSVILVPHASNCLTALLLADICTSANVPPGVISVVPREHEDPAKCTLLASQSVSKVVGIGSIPMGRSLLSMKVPASSSSHKCRNAFMLNGCVPMIVLDTADLDAAVDCVVDAAWSNQGQNPWSLRLLIVQEAVFETMKEKLCNRISRLRLGGAFDKMADVSNVIAGKNIAERLQEISLADPSSDVVLPSTARPGEWAPTLVFTAAPPSSSVLTEEELCPVVHVVGARSAKETVTIANHSASGIAASVWTESNAQAWELASQLQVGTVWVNSFGVIDASVSMNGRMKSGCGSFGGRDGMMEYLMPVEHSQPESSSGTKTSLLPAGPSTGTASIDQTYKLFYGGGHKRPDSNSSRTLFDKNGKPFATVPEASRKDVRNAVEVAVKAQPSWWKRGAHNRAQILYNLAEKLEGRHNHFAKHLQSIYHHENIIESSKEVTESIRILFHWAAVCDKFCQLSGSTYVNGMAVTVTREPVGVVSAVAMSGVGRALSDIVAVVGGALAYGNTCVIAARPDCPTPALEFAQVLEAAEIPAGVINILSGETSGLLPTLASHMEVNAVWCIGFQELECQQAYIEAYKSNMKSVWIQDCDTNPIDLVHRQEFEINASHCKSVWMPTTASFGN